MAVEIKELVIKAIVDEADNQQKVSTQTSTIDKEEIIKACVKQVLKILKQKKQR